jgi:UDP-4-amino-4,6-dideoxy-N-acetyl-beta-L-altrosamine transaminase
MIGYGRQDINQDDIAAVMEVLQSDFLTQGPRVEEFEAAVASFCGAEHGVAVNSATSALHIACMALDIGPDDIVWTSPITFVASANCARYCGATIDFVDIDLDTNNICVDKLEKKLESAASKGALPSAVIPVHMAGASCDMARIRALSRKYDFRVVEDASHAIGGRYKDKPVGGCQFSDITVFSFHPVKIITTAEGGLATTNCPLLAERMQGLRSHGITRDPDKFLNGSDGGWYYEQVELGLNYRMTEIQAVLGLSQLARLNEFVEARNKIAQFYDAQFVDLPLIRTVWTPDIYSSHHLYILKLKDRNPTRRAELYDYLRQNNIGTNVHYIPVHMQPYYRRLGFGPGDFPVAEDYYDRVLTLPIYPALSDSDLAYISNLVKGFFAK